MTVLEIKIGDAVFEATMLEKEASDTCAKLIKYLPYEADGVHASWSGNTIVVPWKIPSEEKNSEWWMPGDSIYGLPGDICWNRKGADELFIVYDIAQFRDWAGEFLLNRFAKITNNLEQLKNVCAEMQYKGVKRVSIRIK